MVEKIDKDDPRQVIWAEMIMNLAKRSKKRDKLRTEEELKEMEEQHRRERLLELNESLEGPTDDARLLTDEQIEDEKDKETAIAITPIDIWGNDTVKEPGSDSDWTDTDDDDKENVPAFPDDATAKNCPEAQ